MEIDSMIWQDGLEYTKTILDTVDMLPLLRAHTDLYDVYDALQEMLDPKVENDPKLKGDIFYWIDIDDLASYLRERYNAQIDFQEEKHYDIRGFKDGANT